MAWDRRKDSGWEHSIAEHSPQTESTFNLAGICMDGFISFAVLIPMLYCLVSWLYVIELLDRVRTGRWERQAGLDAGAAPVNRDDNGGVRILGADREAR